MKKLFTIIGLILITGVISFLIYQYFRPLKSYGEITFKKYIDRSGDTTMVVPSDWVPPCPSYKSEKLIDSTRDVFVTNVSSETKIMFVIRCKIKDRDNENEYRIKQNLLPGDEIQIGTTSYWVKDDDNCTSHQVIRRYDIVGAMKSKY